MSQDAPVRPAPMEIGGAYNRSSRVQAAGLLPAVELFEAAAKDVELPHPPQPIVIADYGASAGHNSLLPIGAAITAIRKRTEHGRPICVVHTDVAENNYTTLFHTLATDPHSYLRDDPDVFPSAVGMSFYQRIVPTNTVTLGWSSWAVQWLSRVPAPIPDHVQVGYSQDEAAHTAYARQAADDWIKFLAARSRELVPGGHLVVLTMALDDGDVGFTPVMQGIAAELDAMAREGVVSQAEVRRMVLPTMARSEADLTAPFMPKDRFSGLKIEHLETFIADDEIWRRFQKDTDANGFGTRWATFARVSLFPTLATALEDAPDRAGQFFQRLESGLSARLAESPQPIKIPLAKMSFVKQSWPR